MDIPTSKQEHYEQVRQELWHYLSDSATPINQIATQIRMNPRTLESFVYGGERLPDSSTIFRIKRFLEEQYSLRDAEHATNPFLRNKS